MTKDGTIVSEYEYDLEGLRVVKKAKGQTIHYVFEGTEPIFEKNITTGKTKSYVYALGKHLARVDGVIADPDAKVYWYTTDHLGSVKAVTDTAGKVVFQADHLAFGQRYNETGDFEEWHSFTGKEFDPETGLYYYNARWYDADTGRFISEDPVGDPNNPNLYSYSANNPLIYIDLTGRSVTTSYITAPDQYATVNFNEKYTGYTIGLGTFDNDFYWDNVAKANMPKEGAGLTVTPTGLTVYVTGSITVSVFGNTMLVNAEVDIAPYSTGDMGLSLAGHGFVSVSDDNGGIGSQDILGDLSFDSFNFKSFDTDFKVGTYDLGSGYKDTWLTSFTLPTEVVMDTKADTITLNMGIYMGVYNSSGDIIIWPVRVIDNIVNLKLDEPGGKDIGYIKPKSDSSSSSPSTNPSTGDTDTDDTNNDENYGGYEPPSDPSSGQGD